MKHAKLAILYGFCEGSQTGKRFEASARQAGFEIVKDARTADVIVAHSGGCYLVPEKNSATKILLVGPSCWPGKPLPMAFLQKFYRDFKAHSQDDALRFWCHKTLWNSVYVWNVWANWRMLLAMKLFMYRQFDPATAVIVRNANDTFVTPNVANLPFASNIQIVNLPGEHDDLWTYPEKYINLMV